jgi:hypothetical protein
VPARDVPMLNMFDIDFSGADEVRSCRLQVRARRDTLVVLRMDFTRAQWFIIFRRADYLSRGNPDVRNDALADFWKQKSAIVDHWRKDRVDELAGLSVGPARSVDIRAWLAMTDSDLFAACAEFTTWLWRCLAQNVKTARYRFGLKQAKFSGWADVDPDVDPDTLPGKGREGDKLGVNELLARLAGELVVRDPDGPLFPSETNCCNEVLQSKDGRILQRWIAGETIPVIACGTKKSIGAIWNAIRRAAARLRTCLQGGTRGSHGNE